MNIIFNDKKSIIKKVIMRFLDELGGSYSVPLFQ